VKKIVIGVVALILILVILIILSLVYTYSFPNIHTEYAMGFSYEKFRSIRKGMSKQQVLKILGEPLLVRDSYYGCFSYSRQTTPNRFFPPGGSAIWGSRKFISSEVCFDENGKVLHVSQNVF
jgi:outer membrane protein assembly factor BamE (lipoprotein component of BamABCDE complex)